MTQLNALPPTLEPHATHNIEPMIELTRTLIEKGHAYESQGHVLFAVERLAPQVSLEACVVGYLVAVASAGIDEHGRPVADILARP